MPRGGSSHFGCSQVQVGEEGRDAASETFQTTEDLVYEMRSSDRIAIQDHQDDDHNDRSSDDLYPLHNHEVSPNARISIDERRKLYRKYDYVVN